MPKTFAQIVTSLIDKIKIALPLLDTKIGAVTRDVFIDPQANELAEIHILADNISKAQSILTATGDDLDYLISNFGGKRIQAQYSIGVVYFIVYSEAEQNIYIPSGTAVSTRNTDGLESIGFVTTSDVVLLRGTKSIAANIKASASGSDSNVAAGLIEYTDFPLIDAVTNVLATSSGRDKETDAELRARAPYMLLGINTGTDGAYINEILALPQVAEAKVLESNSKYSRGIGYVDILIRPYAGDSIQTTIQQIPSGLPIIYFGYCPVTEIVSVYSTSNTSVVYVDGTDYLFVPDETYSKNSYRTKDKIYWLNATWPDGGISIAYSYNPVVLMAQRAIERKRNLTADVLVRNADAIDVYITASVSVNPYYTSVNVANDIKQAVTSYVNNKRIGEALLEVDVACLIREIPGVDNVSLPLTVLSTTEGGSSEDIYINDLQYIQIAENNPIINVI